jgi:predicted nucleotidyltransferase
MGPDTLSVKGIRPLFPGMRRSGLNIPKLGINIPIMGMKNTSLGEALFTKTQQRVLGLLFGKPDRSYYTNEIVRFADAGIGSVQRELQRLESAGLITSRKIGNQKHYQANRSAAIFEELRGIVIKTVGLADVLRKAILRLQERVDLAFIFGSIAQGKERITSDIDVMVVGDASFEDVVQAFYPTQESLGREVNPVVMSVSEFSSKVLQGDRFVSRIVSEPRIFLKGGTDDLGKLVADRPDQGAPG